MLVVSRCVLVHYDSLLIFPITNRNILASASADKQVKIWDVCTGQCNITMQHHTDKVRISVVLIH